jgi:hypothetical protein
MGALTYFVLGVLVSIPVAVLAPFLSTALQKRLSKRSEKQANIRADLLEKEYAEARKFHDDPIAFIIFIGVRILVLTVFWIGQGIVDVVFGFLSNGAYLAQGIVASSTTVTLNFNDIGSIINVIASLADVIFLTLLFRYGIRAYRILKRIRNFRDYEKATLEELVQLGRRREIFVDPDSPNAGKAAVPKS